MSFISWLHAAVAQAALAVELLETRHVRTAFRIMPVKTGKKIGRRGLAEWRTLAAWSPLVWGSRVSAEPMGESAG